MSPVDRSRLGKANRTKGHQAERDLARYLRTNGWPDAERKSDNGWRSTDRESADLGDIRGVDRLVIQVKNVAGMSDAQIAAAMTDAIHQTVAAGADLGILVERRPGKADPGLWWAWVSAWDVHQLITGPVPAHPKLVFDVPVRMQVRHLVGLLHHAGYGNEAEAAA